jgi:AcrR family transcriptional regulator
MNATARRARERVELRQQILDAARSIFVDEGYEALTMRRVAERIEYSPTTIYLYFKDKAELVKALCDETFAGLIGRLQDLARRHKDPLDYLDAGLRAYIDFGLENPSHYFVTFVAPMAHATDGAAYEFERSSGQQAFEFLRRTVEACVATGRFRDVDVDAAAQTLWMAVHGLVTLLNRDKAFPFAPRQRLIDRLMATLLDGLGARRAASPDLPANPGRSRALAGDRSATAARAGTRRRGTR